MPCFSIYIKYNILFRSLDHKIVETFLNNVLLNPYHIRVLTF